MAAVAMNRVRSSSPTKPDDDVEHHLDDVDNRQRVGASTGEASELRKSPVRFDLVKNRLAPTAARVAHHRSP